MALPPQGGTPPFQGLISSSADVGNLGRRCSDVGRALSEPRTERTGAQAESGIRFITGQQERGPEGSITPHRAFFAEEGMKGVRGQLAKGKDVGRNLGLSWA